MKILLFLSLILPLASCQALHWGNGDDSLKDKTTVKVASWNCQTFFDAENDGAEYSEFLTSKKWGKEMYLERLERLTQVIRSLDAEVFVLEEIENENVVHDLSNFLSSEWNQKKLYTEACFAKEEGSSIGCAVISRLPLSDFRSHSIYVYDSNNSMPKVRPIMEVKVLKNEKPLTLFVNHWKSMSGGEEETEIWRCRQENLLCQRLEECLLSGESCLAVGDFNRDILSFEKGKGHGKIILRKNSEEKESDEKGIEVLSPWYRSDGSLVEPGSYFFNDQWSRIDNMFFCGEGGFLYFLPQTDGPWCMEESELPLPYALWSGSGWSDHLPLMCEVWF